MVVGAPSEDSSSTGVNSTPDESANYAGAAYVFTRSGTNWSQEAYLKPAAFGTTQVEDKFAHSVAISGDTVVVGAPNEDSSSTGVDSAPNENANYAGAAYVYARSAGAWTQQAYLKPAAVGTTQVGDEFGYSVAVSGDTVVVGAWIEDSSTTGVNSTPNESAGNSGAAYVFTRSGAAWTQQSYLKSSPVAPASGWFGWAVGVSGDTVIAGEIQQNTVHVFAPGPDIAVEQPAGIGLRDGVSNVNFGDALVGSTSYRTFIITNSGTADLTGLNLTIDGANASEFAVIAGPEALVAPGRSTTFNIAFTPVAGGLRTAALHIASNDADENPFDIALTSFVTEDPDPACLASFSPAGRSHGYNPAPSYVDFHAPCAWTAIVTNSWITITSATNGPVGGGRLYYTVALNTSPQPRSGTIRVGSGIFSITQAAGHPVFVTQPANQSVVGGGTATFSVTINGAPPYSFQWQFSGGPLADGNGVSGATTPTLVLSNVQTSQAGNYRVVVESPGFNTYSSWATLTVSCGFSLSASNAIFSSLNATGSVALTTIATNCQWSVVNTNPWVTILSSLTSNGNGTVVYALAANTTGAERSGILRIADKTFALTQQAGPDTDPGPSLAEALDTEGVLEWSTIGIPAWIGQTLVSKDGVDAAQSGPINHGAAVTAVSVVTGPGRLSFWWKVSSEPGKDYLKFFVNGVQQTRISGETDWAQLSYAFPSGTHTTKWTYSKSPSETEGQDRGWVDQVQFIAGPNTNCPVTLSQTEATYSYEYATGQVTVTTPGGCAWNFINQASWIAPIVDGDDGVFRYSVYPNETAIGRTGAVFIAGQTFTVVQQGAPCFYELSPSSRIHNPAATTNNFWVTTRTGCSWDVANTNDWVTILATSNSGYGQVIYSVAENTSATRRSGNITVAGQLFFISQLGIPLCPFSVSPVDAIHGYLAHTGTISVTAPAGCSWGVVNGSPWITILSALSGTGNGQVTYSVAANPTALGRTGVVHVAGIPVNIRQLPGNTIPPVLTGDFNLGRDFSTLSNPNGVWLFGWAGTVTGSVQPLTVRRDSPGDNGAITASWQLTYDTAPVVICNTNDQPVSVGGGQATLAPREVLFDGGQDGSPENFVVILFTAPTNGQYTVGTTVRPFYSGPPQGDADFHVVKNGTELFTQFLNPGQSATYSNTLALSAGDTIKFLLGRGADGQEFGSIYRIAAWINSSAGSTNSNNTTNPPAGCTIALAPSLRLHGSGSATGLVSVTTQSGCAWNVVKTNSWIRILSSLNNSNNGTVLYALTANTNAQTRSGNILVGGQPFRLTQAGVSPSGTNGPRLQFVSRSETNASFAMQGEPGKMYVVECSEDLIHWTPMSTNAAPSTITDAAVGNAPRRFYRIVETP